MQLENLKYCYFLGIGGIGMSAIARYFNALGIAVSGYDKTPTALTEQLQKEGIQISFEDRGERIGEVIRKSEHTLVVLTPAIPKEHGELLFFQSNRYSLLKRASVLGLITKSLSSFCVAGTHGKTTTSTMLAHLFNAANRPINAFLGGISSNFGSNLLMNPTSDTCIIEADEFDRSFLQLQPHVAIVTSTEADHLDIYGEANELKVAFQQFVDLIDPKGYVLLHKDLELSSVCETIRYGLVDEFSHEEGVFGTNLRVENRCFVMDVKVFNRELMAVQLGVPGIHNAENALAVIGVGWKEGFSETEIRAALLSFTGVCRRFDVHLEGKDFVYIDDYAHHPTAIRFLMDSVKMLYPDLPITLIFQPHLYSRTRDFMEEFAAAVSLADQLILMPIYPARESPIEGVTSERLLELSTAKDKKIFNQEQILNHMAEQRSGVVLTVGAGDIDRIVEPLISLFS